MESLPKRKFIRLQKFDYSSKGAYFITICTANRNPILSKVIKRPYEEPQQDVRLSVGEGLAPPEYFTELTSCGDVVKKTKNDILIRNRQSKYNCCDFTYEELILD